MSTESKPLSWHALQKTLRECTTEKQVEDLIHAETDGLRRKRWLIRMNSRRSVLRSEREKAEIEALTAAKANDDAPWED